MKTVENYTIDCWSKPRLDVVHRNAADVRHNLAVVVAVAGHLEKHGNVVLAVRENEEGTDLEIEPDEQGKKQKLAGVEVMDLEEDDDDDE